MVLGRSNLAINELKKKVINKYVKYIKNPNILLTTDDEDGKIRFIALEKFFNEFAEAYLKPSFQGYTNKIPSVKLKDANEVAAIIGDKSKAGGEYNSADNMVYMYYNRFEKLLDLNESKMLRKKIISQFNMAISILCHEYQHAKQQVYVNLLKSGEVQKAKTFSEQLGKNIDGIATDMGFAGKECIDVIKATRADLYAEMGKLVKTPTPKNPDPILDAFYFNRPIEKDARNTSLKVFREFSTDVLKSGRLSMWGGLFNTYLQSVIADKKDSAKQPNTITKDVIMGYVKMLNAEDLTNFALIAEDGYLSLSADEKGKVNLQTLFKGNSKTDEEFKRETFLSVLKEIVNSVPEQEALKKLKSINQLCEANNVSFGAKITEQYIIDIENGDSVKVRPINNADYAREGIKKANNQPIQEYYVTSRRNAGKDIAKDEVAMLTKE